MNFTPEHLKERTDDILSLLDEVQKMNIDELKLKPREAKAVYQVSTCSWQHVYISPVYLSFL